MKLKYERPETWVTKFGPPCHLLSSSPVTPWADGKETSILFLDDDEVIAQDDEGFGPDNSKEDWDLWSD